MRWFIGLLFLLAFPLSAGAEPLPPSGDRPDKLQSLIPELSLRTSFAHNYGTILEAVVYQGVEYEPGEASAKILPLLGWETREDRLEVGQAWIESIVLFDSDVIRPGDAKNPDLDGPKAIVLPDGTVRYTAWATSMRGRSPGSARTLWRVDISPDGRVTKMPLKTIDPSSPPTLPNSVPGPEGY